MAVIPVDIAGRPYEVRVGAGLLAELVPHCRGRLRKRGVPVITDTNVHTAWGHIVETSLREHGHEPHWRILAAGEQTKSWDELAATVNWLLELEVELLLELEDEEPGKPRQASILPTPVLASTCGLTSATGSAA